MKSSQAESRAVAFPVVPRGAGDIEAFVATIRRLSRARSLEEVMATATPAARSLLGADGITFVLREHDLCHYADEDAISPLWKGKRFPMTACISGWCMMQGRSVAIRNIYEDDRIPHDAYRPTFVKSLAMVPVRREDPLAAMGAYWADETEVTAVELDLLQTMADAAALAIANVELQNKGAGRELADHESAHRTKNIFTVVLSLVRQTEAQTAAEYRAALIGRLQALEEAHSAIFESHQGSVDVGDLLHRLLSAYAEGQRLGFHCEVNELPLSATEVSNLALIVNELGANAAKYGALSGSSGRVTVSCSHAETGLRLTWQERGGPPVTPPSRTGFGTRLLRAILENDLHGHLELEYPPEGFRCEMLLPLAMGRRS